MKWQTPMKLNEREIDHAQVTANHQQTKFITVTCRLKPLFMNEEKSKIQIDTRSHAITLNDPTKSISKTYTFDQVFDQTVRQDYFTNSVCQPLVAFLKNGGESGLIFSYGITNSGKTYTILGTKQQPGILLTLIKMLEQEFKQETLKIVACQLYKDEFFSLKTKGEKLHPKQLRGTFTFQQCNSEVINENNMEELFSQYLTNRSCSSTSFNTVSSRSHAIFKITCGKFRIGLVDLAGSQRSSKGHQNGTDIKETIFINSSLLTLKKCIKSLEEKSQLSQKICIPYRESKLTQSLVQYFAPNSKISIIVNINQARHCLEQNLNVMDYTSKAKNITANVMSDFSQMLKSTARKKQEMINALKSYKIAKSNKKEKTNAGEGNKLNIFKSNTLGKNGGAKPFSSAKTHITVENKKLNSSKKSDSIQELIEVCTALESIKQQNDEINKKSQHAATTICETLKLGDSGILIEEMEYNEFNPEKNENQHKKRYSVQFIGQDHKYIIEEETIENEDLQKSLLIEIEEHQRKSFIEKKNMEQTFQQFVQKPSQLIEEFIKRQQQFRNYLAFDRQFQAKDDAKKLSALKKFNLFETTRKKQLPEERQIQKQYPIDNFSQTNQHLGNYQFADVSIGTDDDYLFNNRRNTDFFNQTLENMDYQKLRTNVKRKLLDFLKDDEKKRQVQAIDIQVSDENLNSLKKVKFQSKSLNKSFSKSNKKFEILDIDQTSVQNEESNFTTPSKNAHKKNCLNTGTLSQQKNQPNSQVNQSILKKTFDKVASGVKYVADKVGLSSSIFKTNTKALKSKSASKMKELKKIRGQMKIWSQFTQMVEPYGKILFLNQESQQVQVTSSIKKVRLHSDYLCQNEEENMKKPEKEIEIVVCEVGIQTEEMAVSFALEEIIKEAIVEEKNDEKKKRNFKRGKHVRIQDSSQINIDESRSADKRKELIESSAFKNNSIRKEMAQSLKKRPYILSDTKSVIAHKTRGAKRRQRNK